MVSTSYFILFSMITLLNYSGVDSVDVCNVESIQKDPLFLVVHLCAPYHYLLHLHGDLYQSQYMLYRYVFSRTAI